MPAPGDHDTLRAELLRLETALATRDPTGIAGGLAALIPGDFLEFGASGRVWDAAATRSTLSTEQPASVTIEGFDIVELAEGVVLATYQVIEPRPANRSSIWVRRQGRWVMRFHQGTLTA